VIYHFMFGPSYTAGCPTNSSIADSFNGMLPHLEAHDVTMICVSGAPIEKLLAYRERMGWNFNWASSYESDFNYDFGVQAPRRKREGGSRRCSTAACRRSPARTPRACGTDVVSYISEGFGFNTFTRERDTVFQPTPAAPAAWSS